jgi:hypothetical protein
MNDLKEAIGKLKEEARDGTVWCNRFGRVYGLVMQTTEWMNIQYMQDHFQSCL